MICSVYPPEQEIIDSLTYMSGKQDNRNSTYIVNQLIKFRVCVTTSFKPVLTISVETLSS